MVLKKTNETHSGNYLRHRGKKTYGSLESNYEPYIQKNEKNTAINCLLIRSPVEFVK